eukprot:TRINITY_DN3235_c2_g1_i1.p1 TRINITY_DN3235_c2_g1~~TRINITY_DN3235_c2_g1_i1.p1  ORF type:complete len:1668 (+),score=566.68 TRINITY_DN3235_c2_g1_i1:92-5095(+)
MSQLAPTAAAAAGGSAAPAPLRPPPGLLTPTPPSVSPRAGATAGTSPAPSSPALQQAVQSTLADPAPEGAFRDWQRDRTVIVAQLHNLILALRTNSRFSSSARFVEVGKEGGHKLMSAAKDLRRELLASSGLLAANRILRPFAAVAASMDATGPITGVALSALAVFLELRLCFVDVGAIAAIVDAALGVRNEVVDSQSHEAVLARILQVLKGAVTHPLAVDLDERVVLRVLQGMIAIAMNGTPTELLRHTAEQAATDITGLVFRRVGERRTAHSFRGVLSYIVSLVAADSESLPGLIGQGPPASGHSGSVPHKTQLAATIYLGLSLTYHVLATLREDIVEPHCRPLLELVQCELCRGLLHIAGSVDNVVVISQMLRTVQLAATYAGEHIRPQLLSFLLGAYLKAEEPAPPHDPYDAEYAPHGQHERREVILESLLELCSDGDFPLFLLRTYDLERLSPNVLSMLCCHLRDTCLPERRAKLTALNMAACNAVLALIAGAASRAGPHAPPAAGELGPALRERLESKRQLEHFAGIFKEKPKKAVRWLCSLPLGPDGRNPFGLGSLPTGREMGEMLYEIHPALDRKMLGEFISDGGIDPEFEKEGKPGETKAEFEKRMAEVGRTIEGRPSYHLGLRQGFYSRIPVAGASLIDALRICLATFLLPGEAQRIDRVLEELSKHWWESNAPQGEERDPQINPFHSPDGCFVFAFSVIMLNTDMHSSQVQDKMTLQQFFRNNKGINDGKDLPHEYQEAAYAALKRCGIKLTDALHVADDHVLWDKLVERGRAEAAAAAKEPPIGTPAEMDLLLFERLCRPAVTALSVVTEAVDEDAGAGPAEGLRQTMGGEAIINDAMQGLFQCAQLCCRFQLHEQLDQLVAGLCRFCDALQPSQGPRAVGALGRSAKGLLGCKALFRILAAFGDAVRGAWVYALDLVLRMWLLGCMPQQQARAQGQTQLMEQPQSLWDDAPTPLLRERPMDRARLDEGPQQAGSSRGWWAFGGGEEQRRSQQAQQRAEASRVWHTVRECNVTAVLLDSTASMPAEVLGEVVGSLVKVSGVDPAPPADGQPPPRQPSSWVDTPRACLAIHVLGDIAVANAFRYEAVAPLVDPFLQRALALAGGHLQRKEPPGPPAAVRQAREERQYWSEVGEAAAVSRLRVFARLFHRPDAQETVVDALHALAVLDSLPEQVFGPLASPHCGAAFASVLCGGQPRLPQMRDAEGWRVVLSLTVKSGLLAASTPLAHQCLGVLCHVAAHEDYICPGNTPTLAKGLVNLYLLLAGEGAFDAPPAGEAEARGEPDAEDADWEMVKVPTQSGAGAGPQQLGVVAALCELRSRLVSSADSVRAPSAAWAEGWKSVLCALADVVATPVHRRRARQTADDGEDAVSRERNTALRALHRAVLADAVKELPCALIQDTLLQVLLPLVSRVCDPAASGSPSEHGGGGAHGFFGRFSVQQAVSAAFSAVDSAVFGPIAGQGHPAQESSQGTPQSPRRAGGLGAGEAAQPSRLDLRTLEDLQTRVLSLLCQTFLSFHQQLTEEYDDFVRLWRRLLGTLYAYHTRPPAYGDEAGDALRDSVCECVKNIVLVVGTQAARQDSRLPPAFWEMTWRDLLQPFGAPVATELEAFLGRLRGAPPPPPTVAAPAPRHPPPDAAQPPVAPPPPGPPPGPPPPPPA